VHTRLSASTNASVRAKRSTPDSCRVGFKYKPCMVTKAVCATGSLTRRSGQREGGAHSGKVLYWLSKDTQPGPAQQTYPDQMCSAESALLPLSMLSHQRTPFLSLLTRTLPQGFFGSGRIPTHTQLKHRVCSPATLIHQSRVFDLSSYARKPLLLLWVRLA